jgi:uncharacterized protein YecE (DUF72 family)
MKFGKLEDLSPVNFNLPPDDPRNKNLLNSFNTDSSDQKVYLGTTSWGTKEWKGNLYPPKAKASDFLKYYAEQFNAIELNTTHYGIPKIETIQKWKESVQKDFRFCPKLLQTISHSRDLGQSTERLNLFIDAVSLLEEHLGPIFMQLPPYFRSDRLGILNSFLSSVPDGIKLAVEFRNEDLFIDRFNNDFYQCLLQNKCTPVITDVAGRRDVLHSIILSDQVFIRFVANNHPSDWSRLDQWIDRFKIWFEWGLKEIFFFIHSPSTILTPKISVYLSRGINSMMGKPLSRAPLILPF